jgi:hypothetical protein
MIFSLFSISISINSNVHRRVHFGLAFCGMGLASAVRRECVSSLSPVSGLLLSALIFYAASGTTRRFLAESIQ